VAGRLRGRFDLQQRDPCMIEKHSARRRELHSAGSSNEKVCAQFLFETANLGRTKGRRRAHHQLAVLPPFTRMICPVIYVALPDATKTIASAISAGEAPRFRGTAA